MLCNCLYLFFVQKYYSETSATVRMLHLVSAFADVKIPISAFSSASADFQNLTSVQHWFRPIQSRVDGISRLHPCRKAMSRASCDLYQCRKMPQSRGGAVGAVGSHGSPASAEVSINVRWGPRFGTCK